MQDRLAKLVNAINRVGIQNIALLSRMTGIPVETIRYTIKKRFPELGLFVGLHIDYDNLGLERQFAVIEFAPDASSYAPELLKRLAKLAFLTYCSRELLKPIYIANFGVPASQKREFQIFIDRLAQEKIINGIRIEKLEWMRNLALRSEYYDYSEQKWSIDWSKVALLKEPPPAPPETMEPQEKPDIDLTDLLLIKELELQAWRSIAEIAEKLQLNDRTARWHFNNHVGPLIKAYYVHRLSEGSRKLTTIVGLIHEFHKLQKDEFRKIRRIFSNFPFTWKEGGREDGYYRVVSTVPVEHLVESMHFLNSNLQKNINGWHVYTLDLSFSYSYTVPYENFSNKEGWLFDAEETINSILEVKPKK